jgi:hypothetical protein
MGKDNLHAEYLTFSQEYLSSMELVFCGLFDLHPEKKSLDFIGILMIGSKQHVTEDSSEGEGMGEIKFCPSFRFPVDIAAVK